MLERTFLVLILISISAECIAKPMSTTSAADTPANIIADQDIDYRTQYAAQMISYMNSSVQPCDDFYEYACGNWKNVIQPRQAEHKRSNLLDIIYRLGDIVEALLQRPNINDVAPEYEEEFQLAKKFYNNCLESQVYPMKKSSVYLDVLKSIGGFPAVDTEWNASEFNWLNMSSHMSNYGVNGLIKEAILPIYPFPPYFQVPDFGFDIELHYDNIKNTSMNAYIVNEKHMDDILTLYGVTKENRVRIISDIFEFLKAVLSIIEDFEESNEKCMDLSESMETSDIDAVEEDWAAYYEIAWNGTNFIENDEKPCPYFYHKLKTICDDHKEAAANYLSLKFLYQMDARLKSDQFHKDFCISSVRNTMDNFFDHLYMKIHFNRDIRDDVQKMIKDIRQSLHTILLEADWLDEMTRNAALLKEITMLEHIGRSEDDDVIKRLLCELKNLRFVEDNYEANVLNMKKFKRSMIRYNGLHHMEISNLSKPLAVFMGMEVNAFYYNIDNAIYVMAGVVHPPAYHKAWPNTLKYATLGFLVGHEFTHGFDTIGANYDHDGKFNYWWSNKSGKVFDERSDCYAKHYQNYSIPEINRNINGNMTKDENIADTGGLRMAFLAYRRYMKDVTKNSESMSNFYKEEQMPGLDLTPDQLFFLGAAQMWCSSYKEADYWRELSDEHTIDKYRVWGMMSNNDEFAKAYNCPKGSQMNPSIEKCKIW